MNTDPRDKVLRLKDDTVLRGLFEGDLHLAKGDQFILADEQDECQPGEQRERVWVYRLFPMGADPTKIEVPMSIFE